mgnify:CR=1 FL=1
MIFLNDNDDAGVYLTCRTLFMGVSTMSVLNGKVNFKQKKCLITPKPCSPSPPSNGRFEYFEI